MPTNILAHCVLGDQKAETAAVAELAVIIRADNQELGEKVDQVQKLDKTFRDLQAQQVNCSRT